MYLKINWKCQNTHLDFLVSVNIMRYECTPLAKSL